MFLQTHKWPLIIDEVQKAPGLFNAIEEIVNNEKMKNPNNYGVYILTGSQTYRLMNGVSESLAGRIAIIHMSPLSRSGILNREETPFDFDIQRISERARENPLSVNDLHNDIVKGFYPELYSNPSLSPNMFYSDYVEAYIVNEIRKSFYNNGKRPDMYYYRDDKMNEIGLIIFESGKLHRVECKAGIRFNMSDVKAFQCVSKTNYPLGTSGIVCNTDVICPLSKEEGTYAFPLAGI